MTLSMFVRFYYGGGIVMHLIGLVGVLAIISLIRKTLWVRKGRDVSKEPFFISNAKFILVIAIGLANVWENASWLTNILNPPPPPHPLAFFYHFPFPVNFSGTVYALFYLAVIIVWDDILRLVTDLRKFDR